MGGTVPDSRSLSVLRMPTRISILGKDAISHNSVTLLDHSHDLGGKFGPGRSGVEPGKDDGSRIKRWPAEKNRRRRRWLGAGGWRIFHLFRLRLLGVRWAEVLPRNVPVGVGCIALRREGVNKKGQQR